MYAMMDSNTRVDILRSLRWFLWENLKSLKPIETTQLQTQSSPRPQSQEVV